MADCPNRFSPETSARREVEVIRLLAHEGTEPMRRLISRVGRAARRRRDSANHTPLVADPPTALAVTAEGASCAARAVPSDSVPYMLAARRVPTDRFADGVPGAGRDPGASLMTNASSRAA